MLAATDFTRLILRPETGLRGLYEVEKCSKNFPCLPPLKSIDKETRDLLSKSHEIQ